MKTRDWLIKEGYPLTIPMTRAGLADIIDRYIYAQKSTPDQQAPFPIEWVAVPVSNAKAQLVEGFYVDAKKTTFQLIKLQKTLPIDIDKISGFKTVQERDNLDLLELVCELHFRAIAYPSEKMHSYYMEARTELEKRIAPPIENKEVEQVSDEDLIKVLWGANVYAGIMDGVVTALRKNYHFFKNDN